MPSSSPQLLVFDLDGTLIDSRVDLCNSVNAMLKHLGKPELPQQVIASYIGDGASMLVRRALGDPEGDSTDEQYVTAALTYFLDYYRVHKLDFTYVYPGVVEALEAVLAAHPQLPMCLVPAFGGAYFSGREKEALWDRFYTGAPQRQRRSVERYNIVKRA